VKNPIRVVLVDDHPLLREGLAALLREDPDIAIVGMAANGQEALDTIPALKPDLVLMDINMPVIDGLEATRRLLQAMPEMRVLVLSANDTATGIAQAMQAGAKGYVHKAVSADVLLRAMKTVHSGLTLFPPIPPSASKAAAKQGVQGIIAWIRHGMGNKPD
jgi:DNA-binding NarL/FixJ family response regulator